MRVQTGRITLELIVGDLTRQSDLEAIVNAANNNLTMGGGVCGAIFRRAGIHEMREACAKLAPIPTGSAVITEGFSLPNRYVIHAVGPIYRVDEPSEEFLRRAWNNALMLAEEHNIRSLGFPAISTGIYGYPVGEAAQVALREIISLAPYLWSLKLVRIVLHKLEDYDLFAQTLSSLLSS
ncbi:MAG: macro domain-containing protein [Campylobacterales bacterium]